MAIVKFLRACTKNVPGIRPEVYVVEADKITTITEAGEEITVITQAGGAGDKFKRIQADMDSVQFTSDANFKTSGGHEQELIMRFSKPRKEANVLVSSLRDGVACGLVAIYIDNNAQGWLYGANGAAKEGLSRPINELAVTVDSGTLMTDADTQAVTVTLKRMSGFLPVPLSDALMTDLRAGTAAFIDWT